MLLSLESPGGCYNIFDKRDILDLSVSISKIEDLPVSVVDAEVKAEILSLFGIAWPFFFSLN